MIPPALFYAINGSVVSLSIEGRVEALAEKSRKRPRLTFRSSGQGESRSHLSDSSHLPDCDDCSEQIN